LRLILMFEYPCIIRKIIDGDTVDVDIDLGFDTWLLNQRIRLYGIDTPESRTRDLEEKKFGLIAKKFVQTFCPVGSTAVIKTKEKGKYGRYLGDLRVNKKWLCAQLLLNHMAVVYHGQSKTEIKAAHLENRSKVV
jgi:micrococcal nuclease